MTETLTKEEVMSIAKYTVQKIRSYPKRLGYTVENYFDILYPNEVGDYLMRREINGRSEASVQRVS